MVTYFDVAIVGAGHGGAAAAIALRQRGFAGSIALIGDELDPPYERPPLSKDYLAGDRPLARLLIRPEAFWSERRVELLLGTRIDTVDSRAKLLGSAAGGSIGYGTLIWATGGSPRRLTCAGHDLRGVHAVRTRADVDHLIAELPQVDRIVVVGGGYIGLEAAAVLTSLGKHVTVLEAQGRVLARVAGAPLSRFYEAYHRAHGVDVRLNVATSCIAGRAGAACGVRLESGEIVAAEAVIVGIGIEPAVAPLVRAGADGTNGVIVDAYCRTSLPDVFAIGDCAAHANAFADGAVIRLESVQNANDQAATVAKALTGAATPYAAVPWFWSNQYALKLQTIGLSTGHDQIVQRGTTETDSFSLVYLRRGRVIALDCVNATRDFVQGRKLVEAGARPPIAALADAGTALRDL